MKVLFALLVHLTLLPSCLGKCYYPNGQEAVTDVPCDPDAEASACCSGASNFASSCLSNKLCQSASGRIIRGSCTDPTWLSPECPRYCLNWPTNGWDMVSCSNVTQKDTSYCCNTMRDCCDGGIGRFDVLPAQPDTWALWDNGKSRYVVVTPLSKQASSTSASSSATSSSATQSATGTTSNASQQTSATDTSASPSRSQPPSTETVPSGQTATTQPSSAESNSSSPSGLSTAAQAGIGVGAGVGALLVAAVAYLWWKLHKVQQAQGGEDAQWQGPQDPYATQSLAPPYYPEEPRRKYELQGVRETHELQGHHYYVQGDTSSAELTTQPHYAVESPVATSGIAR